MFIAIAKNVLVRPRQIEEVRPSGLYLPEGADTNPEEKVVYGTVINFGAGVDTEIEEGDEVILIKGGWRTDVLVDGVEHLLVHEDQIIAVLERSK